MATAPVSPTPEPPAPTPSARRPGSLTAGLRRVAERLAAASLLGPDGRPGRLHHLALGLRILVQAVRQWARDRCPQQAASLAFQSALSIVPLVAIALAFLRASGAFEAEGTLVQVISKQVNPVEPELVTGRILEWSKHLDFRSAGLPG